MSSRDGARYGRCAASQAAASRLHRTEADTFIEAAHPISPQVDRDVLIADVRQLTDDLLPHAGLERARQLVDADLEAGQRVVMAHAAHPEAERPERRLGALDHAQLLASYLRMVRNARRETRRRRLVPGRQSGAARQLADIVLGQTRFVERAADAEFPRRFPAGPIITAIVGIASVGDGGETAISGKGGQRGVELVLAVVAAVDRVGAVLGPLHLCGADDLVMEGEVASDPERELPVAVGIAGAVSGDAEG